jgi:catechol 2,3-dioxygenase-like lactoylglutathione lyase family enzyme
MNRFNIAALDHVAIGVADVERSCAFYARVLGFERVFPEWDRPVFMGTEAIGVAIFDQDVHAPSRPDGAGLPGATILHFAFRVDRAGLEAARSELAAEDFKLTFTDHGLSHSLYFRDPDGHLVELTTYDVQVRVR